eukprot:365195-Chlamydomonas_euryale.AAC.23
MLGSPFTSCLAEPKSHSFSACDSVLTSRFWGLMSAAPAAAAAGGACRKMDATMRRPSVPQGMLRRDGIPAAWTSPVLPWQAVAWQCLACA